MWYYRPNKFFFIALIVILILSTTVKAELIYQPTESKIDKLWRRAGSSLFDGLSLIFDGLVALEQKDPLMAKKVMEVAELRLKTAKQAYTQVIKAIKRPRKIKMRALPRDRHEKIQRTFLSYKVQLPADELAVAKLAVGETERLIQVVKERSPRFEGNNLPEVQLILQQITRLLQLGTYSAEMMVRF